MLEPDLDADRLLMGLPPSVPVEQVPPRALDLRPDRLYLTCPCRRRVALDGDAPRRCACGRTWRVLVVCTEAPS